MSEQEELLAILGRIAEFGWYAHASSSNEDETEWSCASGRLGGSNPAVPEGPGLQPTRLDAFRATLEMIEAVERVR